MTKRLDAATIRSQIDGLLAAHPELADDDVLRADMFEGETDLGEYLTVLERKRRGADAYASAIGLEIEELKVRRERFLQRDQSLRRIMLAALQWADLPKVELPIATIAIRKGTARVVIVDPAAIPDQFCRIVREPDKTKIKEAIANADPDDFDPVPGASMSNAEPVLTVRIK